MSYPEEVYKDACAEAIRRINALPKLNALVERRQRVVDDFRANLDADLVVQIARPGRDATARHRVRPGGWSDDAGAGSEDRAETKILHSGVATESRRTSWGVRDALSDEHETIHGVSRGGWSAERSVWLGVARSQM